MAHGHAHGHRHDDGHAHARHLDPLLPALALTLAFAAVEAVGGWWTNSLALLGDAGHMFSDAMALGVTAAAAWFSRRPPSPRHSYGLVRAEIVAALVNGVAMLLVVVGIAVAAVERLRAPQAVQGLGVMVIAGIGLAVNALVLALLSRGEKSLGLRGALLHVVGDLLGSVAALIAGAVIYFTHWTPIDPILSLVISALILYSTFMLLRETLNVLMEGVPLHLDLNTVAQAMLRVPGVVSVHDLHIWTLSSGMPALSAHIVVGEMAQWARILNEMRATLRARFSIDHVTLQPELGAAPAHAYAPVIPIRPERSP